MKLQRGKVLVDPPASASSDIAFILIIFFLVCAAVQPETGIAQVLPKTEEKKDKQEQSKNLEVWESSYQLGVNIIYYAHAEYNKWLERTKK